MAIGFDVEVDGLDDLLDKLTPALLDTPLRSYFGRTTTAIVTKAKTNAPVDIGKLKRSIHAEIDKRSPPTFAKVVAGAKHAAPMEFGTGRRSDSPDSKGGRHFPPPAALEGWARRHGLPNGFVVARAIARKGGLKPRRYMRNAFESTEGARNNALKKLAKDTETEWGK